MTSKQLEEARALLDAEIRAQSQRGDFVRQPCGCDVHRGCPVHGKRSLDATPQADAAQEVGAKYTALVRRLQDLTPSGSEFVDSPENCINYAIRRMDEQAWLLVTIAAERNALARPAAATPDTAQKELVGALAKLDALYSGFRQTVEHEDWGDAWFDEALPEVRAAFTFAADMLDKYRPAAAAPDAEEDPFPDGVAWG